MSKQKYAFSKVEVEIGSMSLSTNIKSSVIWVEILKCKIIIVYRIYFGQLQLASRDTRFKIWPQHMEHQEHELVPSFDFSNKMSKPIICNDI